MAKHSLGAPEPETLRRIYRANAVGHHLEKNCAVRDSLRDRKGDDYRRHQEDKPDEAAKLST